MSDLDFQAWRCKHDMSLFCPDEGCPKHLGCARDKGWKPGEPTPKEYQGKTMNDLSAKQIVSNIIANPKFFDAIRMVEEYGVAAARQAREEQREACEKIAASRILTQHKADGHSRCAEEIRDMIRARADNVSKRGELAQALRRRYGERMGFDLDDWEDLGGKQEDWLQMVDAILDCLMEPSEEMRQASLGHMAPVKPGDEAKIEQQLRDDDAVWLARLRTAKES